jgi:hypothetical protein
VKRHLAGSVLQQLPPPSLLEGLGDRDVQRMTLAWGVLQQQLARWAEGPSELETRALVELESLSVGEATDLAFLAPDAESCPRVEKTSQGLVVQAGLCFWTVAEPEEAVELLTRSR